MKDVEKQANRLIVKPTSPVKPKPSPQDIEARIAALEKWREQVEKKGV